MAMNIELLTRIANKLRRMRHKEHFNMDVIAYPTECGTAACIAGLVLLDAGYKIDPNCNDTHNAFLLVRGRYVGLDRARRLLRLTDMQANRLFQGYAWPEQFGGISDDHEWGQRDIYNDPKVAAKRIEHFIATKGKE